jgi:hypothetical protein
LKKNVDLAVDRLEAKFEEQLDKDPVSKNAPRKRRTTLSPFEAGMMVIANENTTRMLMQFWILYGIFNFLIQYNIIYSEELRILVIFLIILPSFVSSSSPLSNYSLNFLFDHVATNILHTFVPYIKSKTISILHQLMLSLQEYYLIVFQRVFVSKSFIKMLSTSTLIRVHDLVEKHYGDFEFHS